MSRQSTETKHRETELNLTQHCLQVITGAYRVHNVYIDAATIASVHISAIQWQPWLIEPIQIPFGINLHP